MTHDSLVQRADEEAFIEIPVAADGTAFLPSCGTSRSFTIGRKFTERHFRDYFDALAALRQMQRPHWRRTNRHGHRGIVVGVEWRRFARAVVEAEAQQHRLRMS